MITQTSRQTFQVPINDLFAYLATPKNWVEWNPGTSFVKGPKRPPRENECWEESLRVSGFHMKVDWVAKQVDAPSLCLMKGEMKLSSPLSWLSHGATVTLRYDLHNIGEDTHLKRTVSYNFPNPFLRLMDHLFLQRKTERETVEALSNLKRIVEDR